MKPFLSIFILTLFTFSSFGQSPKPAVKPQPKTAAATPNLKAALLAGKTVYDTYCVSCHMVDGKGVETLNPPLVKTAVVLGAKPTLINILLDGMQGVKIAGKTYLNIMPSQDYLTDKEISDVLTYVRNSFGNKATAVTVAEVAAARSKKQP